MNIYGMYKVSNQPVCYVMIRAKTQNHAMKKLWRLAKSHGHVIHTGCTMSLDISADIIGSPFYGKTESDFTSVTVK